MEVSMFPLLGGLVSGGMSLLGGMMQQNTQEDMLKQQEAFSAQQAQQQMAFQEKMSDTAYTRAVADMKNAGLNPILAAGGGAASSPGGAMASTPGAPQIQNVLGNAANSAIAGSMVSTQLDKMQAETDNTKSDTDLKDKQYRTEVSRGDLVDAQKNVQVGLLRSMQSDIAKSENLADFFRSPTGRVLVRAGVAGDTVNSALSPVFSTVQSVMGARRANAATMVDKLREYGMRQVHGLE